MVHLEFGYRCILAPAAKLRYEFSISSRMIHSITREAANQHWHDFGPRSARRVIGEQLLMDSVGDMTTEICHKWNQVK